MPSDSSAFALFFYIAYFPLVCNMTSRAGLHLPSQLAFVSNYYDKSLAKKYLESFPFPLSELIAEKWSYRFMPKDNVPGERNINLTSLWTWNYNSCVGNSTINFSSKILCILLINKIQLDIFLTPCNINRFIIYRVP